MRKMHGIAGGALLAVLATTGWGMSSATTAIGGHGIADSTAVPFVAFGEMALYDDCDRTSWGYDDIDEGTQVTVRDDNGRKLLGSELAEGYDDGSGYCIYEFTLENVPTGEHLYSVEVGRRGEVDFTESGMREGVWLVLGDEEGA